MGEKDIVIVEHLREAHLRGARQVGGVLRMPKHPTDPLSEAKVITVHQHPSAFDGLRFEGAFFWEPELEGLANFDQIKAILSRNRFKAAGPT